MFVAASVGMKFCIQVRMLVKAVALRPFTPLAVPVTVQLPVLPQVALPNTLVDTVSPPGML